MARILTVKTALELRAATPNPTLWPVCGECEKEFVLRRALLVSTRGKKMDMHVGWTWVRDCKHRGAKKPDKVERARRKRGAKP